MVKRLRSKNKKHLCKSGISLPKICTNHSSWAPYFFWKKKKDPTLSIHYPTIKPKVPGGSGRSDSLQPALAWYTGQSGPTAAVPVPGVQRHCFKISGPMIPRKGEIRGGNTGGNTQSPQVEDGSLKNDVFVFFLRNLPIFWGVWDEFQVNHGVFNFGRVSLSKHPFVLVSKTFNSFLTSFLGEAAYGLDASHGFVGNYP